MVVASAFEVDGRREQGGAGTQRERGRPGRQGRGLAEELDLDAVAGDVAVTDEADERRWPATPR